MKCPYCAEEIKDEAVVCRHCDRDFFLVNPLREQIAARDSEIASLRQDVNIMRSELAPIAQSGRRQTIPDGLIVLAVTFSVVSAGLTVARLFFPEIAGSASIVVFLLVVAGVGFYLSGALSELSVWMYLVLGIVATLGPLIGLFFEGHEWWGFYGGNMLSFYLRRLRTPAESALTIGLTLFSGALAARWFARTRVAPQPQSLANRIALRVMTASVRGGTFQQRHIQTIGSVISALAPVLTFLASLVGAYLTYLGAITRPPGR